MRILLTGLSSFTGSWFATELARRGHSVLGTLQGDAAEYPALVHQRLAMATGAGVEVAERVTYGSSALLRVVERGWDVVGYHGADVRDYRLPTFDLLGAVERNTRGAGELFAAARSSGVRHVVVSGTVFEPNAGRGDRADRAVTPYGLSKALTWEVLRFHAEAAALPAAKFVIANPFGRYEQARFCTYLVKSWLVGETPVVRTPDYVRDNVPIDALAAAYADFAGEPGAGACSPSGFVGSQGEFTARFAREIGGRLGVAAPFQLATQSDFSEPRERVGRNPALAGWDEAAFWDDLAAYYREVLAAARN